jgi:predicted amidohydrolase
MKKTNEKNSFLVAGIQMDSELGNEESNLKKACTMIDEAVKGGAQLVALPEAFLTGYPPKIINKKAKLLPNDIVRILENKARSSNATIIAGLPYTKNEKLYNSSLLITPHKGLIGIYKKLHLFTDNELNEKHYYTRGRYNPQIYDLGFCKVGLMICYDVRFPEYARKLALLGTELIVIIAAWPKQRVQHFVTLSSARAIENQCYVLAVNRVGIDNNVEFGGDTSLYNPLGEIESTSVPSNSEQVVIGKVDRGFIQQVRSKITYFHDRLKKYGL